MFHPKNTISRLARGIDSLRPQPGSRLICAETGLRAAPWMLAATAAAAIAIVLVLATAGTAQATNYNMVLVGNDNNIIMYWNSQNGEMYRYKIREAGETLEEQGEWSAWRNLQQIPAERHSHTITGLESGNRYMVTLQYQKTLWNDVGTELARVRPEAPQNLSYTFNSENDVTLTWDDPGDPSLVEYMYRITVEGETGSWKRAIDFTTKTPPENPTSFTIEAEELTAGAANQIKLVARNAAGGNSSTITVTVPLEETDDPPYEPEDPVNPPPNGSDEPVTPTPTPANPPTPTPTPAG